jgi:hypothetical protein
MKLFILIIFTVFISTFTLYSQQILKTDNPTIFIKKGDKIEKLIELDSYDDILYVQETSDYIIFFFGRESNLYTDNGVKRTLVYRKDDGCFFYI